MNFLITSRGIKLVVLIISVLIFHGCAGTGVLLKVPPIIDNLPEIIPGFYSVYKITNGKVAEKRGSDFLGEFVYLYKDEYFKNKKLYAGIKGSFLPNRYIKTDLRKGKLFFYWVDAKIPKLKHKIEFKEISKNRFRVIVQTGLTKSEEYQLVFYKKQIALDKMKMIPIAHRGVCYQPPNNYDGIYPANTMPAFETALRSGYQGFELDVHITKDNRFVVSHDENLTVSTTSRGFIEDKNLAEIENSLVIKSAAIPENHATATEAFIAAPLVSLKKVLDTYLQDPRLKTIVIDIKPDTKERIYQATKHDFANLSKKLQQKILFLTRNTETAEKLRQVCPYSYIALEGSIGPEPIEDLAKYFPEAVGLPRDAHNAISFGSNIILAFESVKSAKEKIEKGLNLAKKYNYKIVMWTFVKEWRLNFLRENELFPDYLLLDIPYYKFALQQMRYIQEHKINLKEHKNPNTKEKFYNPFYVRKFNEYVKDFWFKSRTFFEVNYGSGFYNHHDIGRDFSNSGLIEMELGRSEADVYSKQNLKLNETSIFVSSLQKNFALSSTYGKKIKTNIFRFGFSKTDGFGYVSYPITVIPYASVGLTWSKLKNYSPTNYLYKDVLNRFKGRFRFGDRFRYGVKLEIYSKVQLNFSYETSTISPRFVFLPWLGSNILYESGYYSLSYVTSKFMDNIPIWGPIVNTAVRSLYLYAIYLLRKENIYWPFSSETPLQFVAVNFGISFVF